MLTPLEGVPGLYSNSPGKSILDLCRESSTLDEVQIKFDALRGRKVHVEIESVALDGTDHRREEYVGHMNDIFPETLANVGSAKVECEHPAQGEQVLGANATEVFFKCGACGHRWKEDR